MEDVVLHCRPGSAAGLSSLLERTEKLLEPFPCRTPPPFTPWFPTTSADLHLPIRPAKPAPVITCSAAPRDGDVSTSETSSRLHPASLCDRHEVTDSPIKRSWSVFTQRGGVLQSAQSLSKHFHRVVSVHRLHLRQRVKWVVGQHNCGTSRDIEQVWQTLSRSVRSSRLPTCNANIQRERAEIWVFCDVLHSEQVGRFLKDELRLTGRISLSVHRLGDIFSML
ncbi:shieldin complex subunit 3 isoform X2 [Larimichthys crocea]|nr:shieldin complex subunit 3 isoform X2 [Larimichthys crocea]